MRIIGQKILKHQHDYNIYFLEEVENLLKRTPKQLCYFREK
jgi:hypothetical protein